MNERRSGFTLIELLIVVVILGILAAIALLRTNEVTRQAHLSALKSDVRSLALVQEMYHQKNMQYGGLEDLDGFRATEGVDVEVTWAASNGFAATGTHANLEGVTCGIYRGPAAAGIAGPATEEMVVTCE